MSEWHKPHGRSKWTPLPLTTEVETCAECHRTSCVMGVFPCKNPYANTGLSRKRTVEWCLDRGYEHKTFLTAEYQKHGQVAAGKGSPLAGIGPPCDFG